MRFDSPDFQALDNVFDIRKCDGYVIENIVYYIFRCSTVLE